MPDDVAVRLPPLAGRQQESWRAFIELTPRLGDHCLLVGGQMVVLLEVERGSLDTRPTDDVDIVVDLRMEPAGLARVHQTLIDAGFGQVLPSADGIAHRYTRAGATIDVLAPDRLGSRARLALGGGRTIEAPGGSQALVRSSVVKVELTDGSTARVRRPTVVGALLGKVAAVTQIVAQTSAERAKHVRDVDSLARLLGPTDREQAHLTRKERSVLERMAELPDLSVLAQRSIVLLTGRRPTPTDAVRRAARHPRTFAPEFKSRLRHQMTRAIGAGDPRERDQQCDTWTSPD